MDSPKNKFVSNPINDVLDPTPANELSPAYLPTTTISAALNNSCNILEHINGIVNSSILLKIGPLHMSIS